MAYDNNINPGNPPLVWSRIRDAFDQINENFTVIGATLAKEAPYDIETIELTNPVQITTGDDHEYVNGTRATISQTEISQLDGNTYYLKVISSDTVQLYTDENLTTSVDGTAYDSWTSPQAGTIQALSQYSELDFENLTTSVSPNRTDTYNLGSSSKAWQQLYLSEYSTTPGMELNGVWLGTAQIKGSGGIIDLPLNSTVNGELIINPDNTFFKSVQIDNGDRIVADNFVDTLNLLSGSGVSMSADSGAESITINNTGVLSNVAGLGISVSSATGNVTITNSGVRSLQSTTALPSGRTEGAGININGSTGDNLKITNTGVLSIEAGSAALTVFTDAATGIVTITNASPAGNAFRFVDVDGGAATMEANSVAGTLNLVSGSGISLSGNVGTDTVTIAFTGVVDITGSVFADDSTKLVDAVEGLIVGNIDTGRLRTSETKIALGTSAGATNQGSDTVAVGNLAGRTNQGSSAVAIGALSGVTDQGDFATAVGSGAGNNSQGLYATAVGYGAGTTNQSQYAVAIGLNAGNSAQSQGAVSIGSSAGSTNQGLDAVAIGSGAGNTSQGNGAVSIGGGAGVTNQGASAIAIGDSAGGTNQGDRAIAIGLSSGPSNQGDYAIAIGYNAGNGGSFANSIILNAESTALASAAAGFFVAPIRNVDGGTFLNYNATTKEIGYSNVLVGDLTGSVFADNSSIMVNAIDNTLTANSATVNSLYADELIGIDGSGDLLIKGGNSSGNGGIVTLYGGSTIGSSPNIDGYVEITGPGFKVAVTNIPGDSTGQEGDKAGMIAVDNTSIYYCIADWASPGTANIWVKQDWSTTGAW